jgi:hypothetical protein
MYWIEKALRQLAECKRSISTAQRLMGPKPEEKTFKGYKGRWSRKYCKFFMERYK